MSFRLVPKSVTLNDLERHNNLSVILPNSVAFGTDYVKVIEDNYTDTFCSRNVGQLI